MKIAVFTKSTLKGHPARKALLDALSKEGGFVIEEVGSDRKLPKDSERLLAFGGDGTMLDAAVLSAKAGIPVLGVNLGDLGFLTQFDAHVSAEELARALRSAAVKRRMLMRTGYYTMER